MLRNKSPLENIDACSSYEETIESDSFSNFISRVISRYCSDLNAEDIEVLAKKAGCETGIAEMLGKDDKKQMNEYFRTEIQKKMLWIFEQIRKKGFIDTGSMRVFEHMLYDGYFRELAKRFLTSAKTFRGDTGEEVMAFFNLFTIPDGEGKSVMDFRKFISFIEKRVMESNMTEYGKKVTRQVEEVLKKNEEAKNTSYKGHTVLKKGKRGLLLIYKKGYLKPEEKDDGKYFIFDKERNALIEGYELIPDLTSHGVIQDNKVAVWNNKKGYGTFICLDTMDEGIRFKSYKMLDLYGKKAVALQDDNELTILDGKKKGYFEGVTLLDTVTGDFEFGSYQIEGTDIIVMRKGNRQNIYSFLKKKYLLEDVSYVLTTPDKKFIIAGKRNEGQTKSQEKTGIELNEENTYSGKDYSEIIYSIHHGLLNGNFKRGTSILEKNGKVLIKGTMIGKWFSRTYSLDELLPVKNENKLG